jgi:hypothetical protein
MIPSQSYKKRRQQGLIVRTPPHCALLLVACESHQPPSSPEYTKTAPQTGGFPYLLTEKSLKMPFSIKSLNKIYLQDVLCGIDEF